MTDKIIQITTALSEDDQQTFGLSESGKLYQVKWIIEKDENGEPKKDTDGRYIYINFWEFVTNSPELKGGE